jgi:hypothetical protein
VTSDAVAAFDRHKVTALQFLIESQRSNGEELSSYHNSIFDRARKEGIMAGATSKWLWGSALTFALATYPGQLRAGDEPRPGDDGSTVLLKRTAANDAETVLVKGGGHGGGGGGHGGGGHGGGGGHAGSFHGGGGSFHGSGFHSSPAFHSGSAFRSSAAFHNGAAFHNNAAFHNSAAFRNNAAFRTNTAFRTNAAFRANNWNNWHGNNWNNWRGNNWNNWRGNNWNNWRGNNWWGWRGNNWWGWRGNNWWGWNPWWGWGWGWNPWWSLGWGLGSGIWWGGNSGAFDTWDPGVYYASPTTIYYTSGYTADDAPIDYPMPYTNDFGGAGLQSQPPGYEIAPPPRPWQGGPPPRGQSIAPPPRPMQEDRTYPYDGGPIRRVPMPPADGSSISVPKPATVPLEGKAVSLPAKPAKYTYAAYGEDRKVKSDAAEKGYLVKEKGSK